MVGLIYIILFMVFMIKNKKILVIKYVRIIDGFVYLIVFVVFIKRLILIVLLRVIICI